jgi:hypothetical protein
MTAAHRRDEVGQKLARLFDEEPVEIGEPHPAEPLLTVLVKAGGFGQWLRSFYATEPDVRRSLILCIGRVAHTAAAQEEVRWVIAQALSDPSLQIREAAVRALETLDSIAGALLASYDEKIPWLRDYAERVHRRLSE